MLTKKQKKNLADNADKVLIYKPLLLLIFGIINPLCG